jgi:hypothetical protein
LDAKVAARPSPPLRSFTRFALESRTGSGLAFCGDSNANERSTNGTDLRAVVVFAVIRNMLIIKIYDLFHSLKSVPFGSG